MMYKKPRVALVSGWTDPGRQTVAIYVSKLLSVLLPSSDNITYIATNLASDLPLSDRVRLIKSKSTYIPRDAPYYRLIPYYLMHQFKQILTIIRLLPKVDIFIFAQGGSDVSFLSILVARLAGKKVILKSDGRPSYVLKSLSRKPSKIKIALVRLGETASYFLAHRILPESKGMVDLYHLHRYRHKIGIGSLYVDTSIYKKTKSLANRTYDIGYIGRLSDEKGALEFVTSLPAIIGHNHVRVIIIGNGDLQEEIKQIISENHIQGDITLSGWIEYSQMPQQLNDIKLVVVPSNYEGLSNLALESMACGTLVLATPVGGIPDIIREGETGFIMEDKSPESIAHNVIRILGHHNLEQISGNAHALIEQEYTCQAAVERYRSVFKSLNFKVENNPGLTITGSKTPESPIATDRKAVITGDNIER